jgi:hypothetical protein
MVKKKRTFFIRTWRNLFSLFVLLPCSLVPTICICFEMKCATIKNDGIEMARMSPMPKGEKAYFCTSWYFFVLLRTFEDSNAFFLLNFSLQINLKELVSTFMYFYIFHRSSMYFFVLLRTSVLLKYAFSPLATVLAKLFPLWRHQDFYPRTDLQAFRAIEKKYVH